jgi:hypothetical protein
MSCEGLSRDFSEDFFGRVLPFAAVLTELKRNRETLVKPYIEAPIEPRIKVGAKVAYHGRRWYVRVASAFPLARQTRAVFD